jgi:protein MAK11
VVVAKLGFFLFFPEMLQNALIVIGSYERLLYGLELINNQIEPSFIYPVHNSSISAIESNKTYLVTGSSDETIKLYNLIIKKEIGLLMHHNGKITGLKLIKNQHLITSSEDGKIGIVRMNDFEVLKTLDAHSGPIKSIDIHSSGKVLLSLGSDNTLKCWDLTKGLISFAMKIKSDLMRSVAFSKNDLHFAIFADNDIKIHSIEKGVLEGEIRSQKRINCGIFGVVNGDEVVIFGGENKWINVNLLNGTPLCSWDSMHKLRIKDMSLLNSTLVTCSSDGTVHIWDLEECVNSLQNKEVNGITNPIIYDTKCRLTCINISELPKRKLVKTAPTNIDAEESDFEPIEPKKEEITIKYENLSKRTTKTSKVSKKTKK